MLSDFELAASLSENSIQYEPGTVLESKDAINNSFSGISGIVIINQSSGDLNIIRNAVGISFSKEIR
jgi:archaellum component FlaG (FlaF/FlaG flagellin family)